MKRTKKINGFYQGKIRIDSQCKKNPKKKNVKSSVKSGGRAVLWLARRKGGVVGGVRVTAGVERPMRVGEVWITGQRSLGSRGRQNRRDVWRKMQAMQRKLMQQQLL